MKNSTSKLENNRQIGRHQVDEQRMRILNAAELLFLRNGLENTKMVEIAGQAGITKITLYRYFPNRDAIALEIQARTLERIASLVTPGKFDPSLDRERKLVQAMIRNFDTLRDSYRYMGMFDRVYMDNDFDSSLVQSTKNRLVALTMGWDAPVQNVQNDSQANRFVVIISTVIWFLEKLAMRGELTWSDQKVPLEEHLRVFEEMIMGYIGQFLEENQAGPIDA